MFYILIDVQKLSMHTIIILKSKESNSQQVKVAVSNNKCSIILIHTQTYNDQYNNCFEYFYHILSDFVRYPGRFLQTKFESNEENDKCDFVF